MPLILGFGCKARSGKDESIKAILADIGDRLDARSYGFGDALKVEVNEAAAQVGSMRELIHVLRRDANLPDWVVFDENAPMDDPLSPLGKQRTLLQWWGTEYRRTQDPDYWIKKLMTRIVVEKPDVALIRDLRFPNEFAAVREAGGFCVKVVRVGFVSDVPEHPSEHALDGVPDIDWDYLISAVDGNLDGLRAAALDCFSFLADFTESCGESVTRVPCDEMVSPVNPSLPTPVVSIDPLNRDWAYRFCK